MAVVKIRKLLSIILSSMMMCLLFTACPSVSTHGRNVRMGDLDVYVGQLGEEACAVEYYWDGTEEGLTIHIPDCTDDGVKITEIGGHINIGVPALFSVSIKPFDEGFEAPYSGAYGQPLPEDSPYASENEKALEEYMSGNPLYGRIVRYEGDDESLYDGPISFEDLEFTVYPGQYVQNVLITNYENRFDAERYIGIKQEDGSIIFYTPVITVVGFE